jgi:hypothetical protein
MTIMEQQPVRKVITCIVVLLVLGSACVSGQGEAYTNDVNASWTWETNASDVNASWTSECPCGYLNSSDSNSSQESSQENATWNVQGENWELDGNPAARACLKPNENPRASLRTSSHFPSANHFVVDDISPSHSSVDQHTYMM